MSRLADDLWLGFQSLVTSPRSGPAAAPFDRTNAPPSFTGEAVRYLDAKTPLYTDDGGQNDRSVSSEGGLRNE